MQVFCYMAHIPLLVPLDIRANELDLAGICVGNGGKRLKVIFCAGAEADLTPQTLGLNTDVRLHIRPQLARMDRR